MLEIMQVQKAAKTNGVLTSELRTSQIDIRSWNLFLIIRMLNRYKRLKIALEIHALN